MESKKCRKCNEIKSLDNFGMHTKGKDKLRSECKRCHNKATIANKRLRRQQNRMSNSDKFYHVKHRCTTRGYVFEISKEEWLNLKNQPCHYCGNSLDSIKKGSGLDRIDNAIGYTLSNVVPCCYECNMVKGHYLTYEEAKVVLTALKDYRSKIKIF